MAAATTVQFATAADPAAEAPAVLLPGHRRTIRDNNHCADTLRMSAQKSCRGRTLAAARREAISEDDVTANMASCSQQSKMQHPAARSTAEQQLITVVIGYSRSFGGPGHCLSTHKYERVNLDSSQC